MLQTLLIVSISLLALVLIAIGLYYSLQKRSDEQEKKPQQLNSGIYSIVRISPREALAQIKPNMENVERWLDENYPMLPPAERGRLSCEWGEILEHSIAVIEKGDREGRDTYRYDIPESERELLPFIAPDAYITRETIYNHPELLPPFFVGCQTKLRLKEADSEQFGSQSKKGWKPMLPSSDGTYPIPDWRFLPTHLG